VTSTRTALVIGGGIGGPAMAMALQKAGIDATVYEARPNGADGIGVMLTLASNGIHALRILRADGVALSAGFPTPGIQLRSYTGKVLGEARTGSTLPDGTVSHTIKRADLYQALHEEALSRGIQVEHGKRLVSAEDTGDGVRAVFDDGTEVFGDVLIGCDGVHSTVRRIIDPNAPTPTYSGLLTTGGYANGIEVGLEPGSYEMIFGRRAFFGYAAAPSGEVWWFANIPQRDEPKRGEVQAISAADWRARMLDLFADDAGPAIRLIEATPSFPPMTPIHSIPKLPTWHRARMIVTGDAAHAPSPTSGQGASLSIEDAVMLATCLRDLPTPEAAFGRFESLRRPRVERIIKAAARINNNKAPGPVARVLRDAMLPVILKLTASSKSATEVFDHRLDWDARVAAATPVEMS
jgi:2-polyprenyl-6-methoxyphenol hydroxylase-like FAD-dependent oxidoreductase